MHGNTVRHNKGNPRKPLGFKWNSNTINTLGYIWKQYNPSTGRELGKGNKKTLKGYTEVASF